MSEHENSDHQTEYAVVMATPTLDRIKACAVESQAIGDFMGWLLGEAGYVLGAYQYHINVPTETGECHGIGECPDADHEKHQPSINIYHRQYSIQNLLYEYFDIDSKEEERERRAIIEQVRELQRAHEPEETVIC